MFIYFTYVWCSYTYICMVFMYLHMHCVHILTYEWCSYTYICMVFMYLHMHGVHIHTYAWCSYTYICLVFIYLHMLGVHILTNLIFFFLLHMGIKMKNKKIHTIRTIKNSKPKTTSRRIHYHSLSWLGTSINH